MHSSLRSRFPRRRAFTVAVAAGLVFLCGAPPGQAGEERVELVPVPVPVPVQESSPFCKGMRELDLTAGYLASPVAGRNRQTLHYARQDLRLGWMLTSPGGRSWYRGNFEFLLNAFGAEVTQGPGSWMAGGRLLLRYNFVQPGAHWVPFIQIGGGGLGNDIYKDRSQRLVGSGFEFTLTGDLGLRYFVNPRWAIVLTGNFEHISNANSASRNVGVNAAGGMIGVSTFF